MDKTKAEKLTILAARLMECEEQLAKSATVQAYSDAIRSIKACLDIALRAKELVDFWSTVKEVKADLERLEVGDIMKRQFSCDKLYKQLIIAAAKEIEKK